MDYSSFEDIRPYTDEELPDVLHRLLRDRVLLETLREVVCPKCPPLVNKPLEYIISLYLRLKLRKVKNRVELQQEIIKKEILDRIVPGSIETLSISGLEYATMEMSKLFISNHRDIVMDAALIGHILMERKITPPEISFGDNLLMNDLVGDLIRVNRGFIVKRNLPFRERIKASYQLSRYIWHSLSQGNGVWIAQREGRAKDGDDRTNPSLIKMLFLSQRKKGLNFSDFINQCRIVPVAVSYEYDPCDTMKARELTIKEETGTYEKAENEDVEAIIQGIKGFKGRVHLAFGKPLHGVWEGVPQVVDAIDRCIHSIYRLWPSNYIAYDVFHTSKKYKDQYSEKEKNSFLNRFAHLSENTMRKAMLIYANPVINREALSG